MIADLAKNVAIAINNSGLLPEGVEAGRHYLPNFKGKDLADLQVLVIATKPEILERGRSVVNRSDVIRVAFLRKLEGKDITDSVDNLITLVESVMERMRIESIEVGETTFQPDSVTIPNNQTMYSFEDLRESNEFVSIIEIKYTAWVKLAV